MVFLRLKFVVFALELTGVPPVLEAAPGEAAAATAEEGLLAVCDYKIINNKRRLEGALLRHMHRDI